MRNLAGLVLVMSTFLLPGLAFADAGGDAAIKTCVVYMHSTYSVPMSDAAGLHAQKTDDGNYVVSGHATYNGNRHGVDCTIKQGRVNAVEWQ
jgi:uncharacterized protein with FMN-binding domain